jgi:hypothetical protein
MVKAKRVCPHLTSRITLFIALRPLRLCGLCVFIQTWAEKGLLALIVRQPVFFKSSACF